MARRPHYEARYICPIGEQSKSILALRTPTPGLSLVCTFSSTEANGHANRRGIVSEAQRPVSYTHLTLPTIHLV